MPKLTQSLLSKASALAEKKMKIQHDLTNAFIERYGVTYSDVDCDSIIEVLDYAGGDITLEECDQEMTRCGYPPLKNRE